MRDEIKGALGLAAVVGLGSGALFLFDEPGIAKDYAVVVDGKVKEIRSNYTLPSLDNIYRDENGVYALREYIVVKPPIDPKTQVYEGPSRVITNDTVTDTWTVRAKTAAELDADKDAAVNRILKGTFLALCHLKNEVRTKVDGLAAWSEAQCRNAFKSLLP